MTRCSGSQWLLAVSLLVAVGCGGSKPPASSTGAGRQNPTPAESAPVEESAAPAPAEPDAAATGDLAPSCEDALASIDRIHGAGLDDGSAVVFEHAQPFTRAGLREWCKKWSPWMRKCAILAETEAQLFGCKPDLEPLPRSHASQAARLAKEEFYSCVSAATTRAELEACTAAYLGE